MGLGSDRPLLPELLGESPEITDPTRSGRAAARAGGLTSRAAGPDPGRDGERQGSPRPSAARGRPRRRSVRGRELRGHSRNRCSRPSCSASSAAPSRMPVRPRPGSSRPLIRARSSWTRSGCSPNRSRPSSSPRSRTARSGASAARGASRSRSGSSRRATRTWRAPCEPAGFARISITGWPSSSSPFRRSAPAATDILLLAEHFLTRACRDYGLAPRTPEPRGTGRAPGSSVARQRARAGQHDGAGGIADRRLSHQPGDPGPAAAGRPPRALRRRPSSRRWGSRTRWIGSSGRDSSMRSTPAAGTSCERPHGSASRGASFATVSTSTGLRPPASSSARRRASPTPTTPGDAGSAGDAPRRPSASGGSRVTWRSCTRASPDPAPRSPTRAARSPCWPTRCGASARPSRS